MVKKRGGEIMEEQEKRRKEVTDELLLAPIHDLEAQEKAEDPLPEVYQQPVLLVAE